MLFRRHFHVVVVQWRQRTEQKSVMHEQSCCFTLNLFFIFAVLVAVAVVVAQATYFASAQRALLCFRFILVSVLYYTLVIQRVGFLRFTSDNKSLILS